MRDYGFFYIAGLCTVVNLFTAILKEVHVMPVAGALALLAGLCGTLLIYWSMFSLYRYGRVPQGASYLQTTAVVDRGPYTIIRHPQYLGFMLLNMTFIVSNPYWLCVLAGSAAILGFYLYARQEDRRLRTSFGSTYEAYLEEVPGFNAPLGLVRWMRTREGYT